MFGTTYTGGVMDYRSASEINSAMARVYGHMTVAVIISMMVSWFVGTTPELLAFFFTGITKWIVIFAPLAAILALTFASERFNTGQLKLFLWGFAGLMGLSTATIFAVFTMGSIVSAFMGAAVLFAVMSGYGYFTKQSLDSMGKFMLVGLIAIVIASIVNIFIGSTVMQMVISALAIIIFLGLTAYDTQKIREAVSVEGDTGREEVLGALTLYMDFINLLQLFGMKKD